MRHAFEAVVRNAMLAVVLHGPQPGEVGCGLAVAEDRHTQVLAGGVVRELLERVGARQPPVGDIGQSEGPHRAHQRERPGGGHPPRARAEGRYAHLKSRDSNAAAARLRTQAEYTIAYAVARPR